MSSNKLLPTVVSEESFHLFNSFLLEKCVSMEIVQVSTDHFPQKQKERKKRERKAGQGAEERTGHDGGGKKCLKFQKKHRIQKMM